MAISDLDVEQLISELSASLIPPQHAAFEAAARAALAAANCSGIGQAYRLLAPLQRAHWDPPDDLSHAHSGPRHRGGKLSRGPAIDEDAATGIKSAKTRWLRGWR
jgi:hypothetical protein